MEAKKTRSAHYNINYRVVWIPKYRRRVLTGIVKELIEKTILDKASAPGVQILELQVTEDHIHLLVSAPPRHSPSQLVNAFKGRTSRKARKAFPHLSTPFHKYACIRTSMHPHLPRSASSRYSRSTARSRALHERRLGALDTTPYLWNGALRRVNRKSLWTRTYYAETAGTVSSETIKKYIAEQS